MQASDQIFDPSAVSIRPAVAADAPPLAMLRYRFRSELGVPNESEADFVARAATWLASRLAQASWRGWVAVSAAHFHHFKPRLMLLTKQVVMSVRASSVLPSRAIRQEVCDDACTELERDRI